MRTFNLKLIGVFKSKVGAIIAAGNDFSKLIKGVWAGVSEKTKSDILVPQASPESLLETLSQIGFVEKVVLPEGNSFFAVYPVVAKLQKLVDLNRVLACSPHHEAEHVYVNSKGYLVYTDLWQEETLRQALMLALPQLQGKLKFPNLQTLMSLAWVSVKKNR